MAVEWSGDLGIMGEWKYREADGGERRVHNIQPLLVYNAEVIYRYSCQLYISLRVGLGQVKETRMCAMILYYSLFLGILA